MTVIEFFQRFLEHLSAAAVVLFVLLLIGEYFVPGSVLPFVNVIDATLGVVALLVLSVFFSGWVRRRPSRHSSLNMFR